VTKTPKFPRGMTNSTTVSPLATSFWFPTESLEKQAKGRGAFAYKKGKIWLGRSVSENESGIAFIDDRHIFTCAGSRSGKGTSAIIPALCDYPGSVICVDPKGENAYRTCSRRGFGTSKIAGMMQDVYVLDPYRAADVEEHYFATFNALEGLEAGSEQALEEAVIIAEALVVVTNQEFAHWDESARSLIEAVILHVISWPSYEGERNLGAVQKLLRDGDKGEHKKLNRNIAEEYEYLETEGELTAQERQNKIAALENLAKKTPFECLMNSMQQNEAFDGLISGAATGLNDLGARERGSILSVARRNMKFLDSPKMKACLGESDHALKLEDLKRSKKGVTVYLVLPSRLMNTHSRFLRLMLNLTIARLERDPKPPRTGHQVLAILDEFPALGHMAILETAAGLMAGYGLKLWTICQDLSQLKRHYKDGWETFIGNAGILQFFGNSDPTTLKFLETHLGEAEVIRETTTHSESETVNESDLSDFEKVQRTSQGKPLGKVLGSFALENETMSKSTGTTKSTNQGQSIQKTPLMTSEEIRRYFSRASGLQIVVIADYRPMFIKRTPYYSDPQFAGKYTAKSREITTSKK